MALVPYLAFRLPAPPVHHHSALPGCPGRFWLPSRILMDEAVYTTNCIFHCSGAGGQGAGMVGSGDNLLPGGQVAVFLLGPHTG